MGFANLPAGRIHQIVQLTVVQLVETEFVKQGRIVKIVQ